jgi:hypothetical protein
VYHLWAPFILHAWLTLTCHRHFVHLNSNPIHQLRYYTLDPSGQQKARRIGEQGRQFATKRHRGVSRVEYMLSVVGHFRERAQDAAAARAVVATGSSAGLFVIGSEPGELPQSLHILNSHESQCLTCSDLLLLFSPLGSYLRIHPWIPPTIQIYPLNPTHQVLQQYSLLRIQLRILVVLTCALGPIVSGHTETVTGSVSRLRSLWMMSAHAMQSNTVG